MNNGEGNAIKVQKEKIYIHFFLERFAYLNNNRGREEREKIIGWRTKRELEK